MEDLRTEVTEAVEAAITKHERTRHFPVELERFLQENSKAVEWLVDTVRGPRITDPVTGKVTEHRAVSEGLDARTRRIEEKVDQIMRELGNGGVRAKLTMNQLARIAVGVGVVAAGIVQGAKLLFGA